MGVHQSQCDDAHPDDVTDFDTSGTNPVQLTRGMEKTVAALVKELKNLSTEVKDDATLASVASVSAGNNADIGKLIADAMAKVGQGETAVGPVTW